MRLLQRIDIDNVFKQATAMRHDGFVVLGRKNDLGYPRLGMVCAKRNVKLSVHRNSLKRYIREGFRLNQARLNGWDIVILVKTDQLLHQQDKLACLDRLWTRWVRRCATA